MSETFLSRRKIASRGGFSPNTLKNYAERGIGPEFVKVGGSCRYSVAASERVVGKALRPQTRGQFVHFAGRALVDALHDIHQIRVRIDAVCPTGCQQRLNCRHLLSTHLIVQTSQFLRPMAIMQSFCHVGHEVEVDHRWRARRVRCQSVERCAGGEVAHVEATPGVDIVVPAWMLDPPSAQGWRLGRRACPYQRRLSCISY